MSSNYSDILNNLAERRDLSEKEATWLMEETMSGNLTPVQIAGWLMAARTKGESPLEIALFAKVMRRKAVQLPHLERPMVDTCGTGGDQAGLINISTLSALVLAAQGVKIAKHGNRAVSSKSGSADLLERLGYPLSEAPEEVSQRLEDKNFAFLFAPNFHPAMKYAGPVRQELGVRTVFNILGPLANPAGAEIHLLGVYTPRLLDVMAECLKILDVKYAMVVHGEPGLDEISPVGNTQYRLLNRGKIISGTFNVKEMGIGLNNIDTLRAKDADDAFEKAVNALSGKFSDGTRAVAINAAGAKYLYDLHEGKTSQSIEDYLIENVPKTISFIENQSLDTESLF